MYGYPGPIDPDDTERRLAPPTEEPSPWDDRPMPRSAYLFGDEPAEPVAGPNASHRYGARPVDYTWTDASGKTTSPGDTSRTRIGRDVATHRRGAETADGRPGGRRRARPILIAGTVAAATLAVAVGVGAALLPADRPSTTATADELPVAPPLAGADLFSSPSPSESPSVSPSPTTASPSPTPSPSATPTPSRTTAPSRQSVPRTTPPQTTAPPSTSAAPPPPPPTATSGASEQEQVVALVNAERAKAGCGAVTVNAKLTTAAQRHSEDQAAHQNMSHTGSDGSNVADRLDRVDYSWRSYGENVAWNQATPAAVMTAWMNSSGHRANILNCSFTEIGVGVARSNGPYWTQVFGTPR